jgi:threonine/homoserine/homoserine lactone efflux protein
MSLEFLITSLIVIVSPGTGVLYTLAAGLSRGARASVVAAFGCTLGIVPHMAAAVLGLAALLHASALAFQTLKWLGVAYLLYMAWNALREKGALRVEVENAESPQPFVPAHSRPKDGVASLADAGTQGQEQGKNWVPAFAGTNGESLRSSPNFRADLKVTIEGILINILNPKLSIFFFAFLPQFVKGDEAHPLGHMLMLSAVFMGLTFVVFVGYGLFAAKVREHVISRPRVLTWMRRTFAAAFVALGLRLAFAEP